MASKYFKAAQEKISPESKVFVAMSLDIIDQIHCLIEMQGISQRELAKKLGKSESEISRWLSPGHNMTIKTLSKLSVALNGAIVETPLRKSGYYEGLTFQAGVTGKTKIIKLNPKEKFDYSESSKLSNPSQKVALA